MNICCPDHSTPSVFITFLELLAHVILRNTGLICTHGRTGVRLVTPLQLYYNGSFCTHVHSHVLTKIR
jgi:hypothetical protein